MFDISSRPIHWLFGFGSKFSNTYNTKNTCQAPKSQLCRNYAEYAEYAEIMPKLCRNYAEIMPKHHSTTWALYIKNVFLPH